MDDAHDAQVGPLDDAQDGNDLRSIRIVKHLVGIMVITSSP